MTIPIFLVVAVLSGVAGFFCRMWIVWVLTGIILIAFVGGSYHASPTLERGALYGMVVIFESLYSMVALWSGVLARWFYDRYKSGTLRDALRGAFFR